MEGEYSRQTSKGMVHIPVALEPHTPKAADKPYTGASLTGDWIFTWPQETGAEKTTLANFKQATMADAKDNVLVTGIIEPVSGDTGLLHGIVFTANGVTHFHLSRFDGIHIMALDGDFHAGRHAEGPAGRHHGAGAVHGRAQQGQGDGRS